MSALLTFTAVRIQTGIRALATRIASDERGQDTIEYLGVLLVVAAIVAVVVGIASGLTSTLTGDVSSLISKVFNPSSKG